MSPSAADGQAGYKREIPVGHFFTPGQHVLIAEWTATEQLEVVAGCVDGILGRSPQSPRVTTKERNFASKSSEVCTITVNLPPEAATSWMEVNCAQHGIYLGTPLSQEQVKAIKYVPK